jgi:hypothetical protein
VLFDGLFADIEIAGDLHVRPAFRGQLRDLAFAL